MKTLADDLERFQDMWLSNPAAKLEFVMLIERSLRGEARVSSAVRLWIESEKAIAKHRRVE